MADKFIINGVIGQTMGPEFGTIRVQAFDRDLPSLELRTGSTPSLLGEAVTDAEGRFQITYTLEQFESGDGLSNSRRAPGKNADISFRVFDRDRQELSISHIEALNREYRPGEIIFNVPNPLEVAIFVEVPRPAGETSEYEKLVAQLAPVIQNVPLAELSDADVAFLGNELSLQQPAEVQQRIEWLRRSAILALDGAAPIEAFYGWGRRDVPIRFQELATVPLANLTDILTKLSSVSELRLREALLAAVESNIIPSRLRERSDNIVYSVRRRTLKEYSLRLRLENASSGQPLAGFQVATFDLDASIRDLGTDVTDRLGEFVVAYFAGEEDQNRARSLKFRVRGSGIQDPLEVTQSVKPGETEPIGIPIRWAGSPTLRQLGSEGSLNLPEAILVTLEQTHGIRSFADIRRIGGLGRIAKVRTQDATAAVRLDALADLDRLSSDLKETSALLADHFDSVAAIAQASRQEFVALLSSNRVIFTARRAAELHIAAKAQTQILDQILAGIAVEFAGGTRPPAGFTSGDYFPPFPPDAHHD